MIKEIRFGGKPVGAGHPCYQICEIGLNGGIDIAKSLQNSQVRKCIRLVTFEDHLVDAGFGAWILEAAYKENESLKKITIKGLDPKVEGQVGSQVLLAKKYFR